MGGGGVRDARRVAAIVFAAVYLAAGGALEAGLCGKAVGSPTYR